MNSSSRQATMAALALTFTTFLSSSAEASRAPPVTPSLCQASDYPALCARIARSVNPLTPETLANASINAAATKAMQARATAARLAYSTRNPAMRQALSACRTAYSSALDSLRTADGSIKTTKDKGDIMINLSAAVHNVVSCEENFKEVQNMAFPLRRVNGSLMRLVRNSLAMGSQLN